MAFADPDPPPGVVAPTLKVEAPTGLDAGRYRRLLDAFDVLPRRMRVILALRMPPPGRPRFTLRAIGEQLGIGSEQVRQVEVQAVWALSNAWCPQPKGLAYRKRSTVLAPVIGAAIDRYPIDDC